MSKVDDMLKATRLPDLVLNLGKSAEKEGDDEMFFKVDPVDGDILMHFHPMKYPRMTIPKEHAMTVANWIIENYGEHE